MIRALAAREPMERRPEVGRRDYRYADGGPLEEIPGGVASWPPSLCVTEREGAKVHDMRPRCEQVASAGDIARSFRRGHRVHTFPIRQARPGVTVGGRRFVVSCLHCKQVVMAVTQVGGEELDRLRAHLFACCPNEMVGPSPRIEAMMRHFRVVPMNAGRRLTFACVRTVAQPVDEALRGCLRRREAR